MVIYILFFALVVGLFLGTSGYELPHFAYGSLVDIEYRSWDQYHTRRFQLSINQQDQELDLDDSSYINLYVAYVYIGLAFCCLAIALFPFTYHMRRSGYWGKLHPKRRGYTTLQRFYPMMSLVILAVMAAGVSSLGLYFGKSLQNSHLSIKSSVEDTALASFTAAYTAAAMLTEIGREDLAAMMTFDVADIETHRDKNLEWFQNGLEDRNTILTITYAVTLVWCAFAILGVWRKRRPFILICTGCTYASVGMVLLSLGVHFPVGYMHDDFCLTIDDFEPGVGGEGLEFFIPCAYPEDVVPPYEYAVEQLRTALTNMSTISSSYLSYEWGLGSTAFKTGAYTSPNDVANMAAFYEYDVEQTVNLANGTEVEATVSQLQAYVVTTQTIAHTVSVFSSCNAQRAAWGHHYHEICTDAIDMVIGILWTLVVLFCISGGAIWAAWATHKRIVFPYKLLPGGGGHEEWTEETQLTKLPPFWNFLLFDSRLPERLTQLDMHEEIVDVPLQPRHPLVAPRMRVGPTPDLDSVFDPLGSVDISDAVKSSLLPSAEDEMLFRLRDARELNLSYQNLGDSFQRRNLPRLFDSLENVEVLDLSFNFLADLSPYTFPHLEELYCASNVLRSFDSLPSAPHLRILNVEDNRIRSAEGLERFTSLEELVVVGNPVELREGFQQEIRWQCPSIRLLNGLPIDRRTAAPDVHHKFALGRGLGKLREWLWSFQSKPDPSSSYSSSDHKSIQLASALGDAGNIDSNPSKKSDLERNSDGMHDERPGGMGVSETIGVSSAPATARSASSASHRLRS
eukprot:Rmarinus@m.20083